MENTIVDAARRLGIDDEALNLITSHLASIDPSIELKFLVLGANEEEEDTVPLEVLSALIPNEHVSDVAENLQKTLQPHGVQALVTGSDYGDFCFIYNIGLEEALERFEDRGLVVFFRSDDPYVLLQARATNGANYDLLTDDIIAQLREWSELCEFHLIGAGWDWVDILFETLPADLKAFAEDVYDFCPDTLDQGIIVDVPEHLNREATEFSEEDTEEMLQWMEEALESQTPADLAIYLQREKRLWLWWD